MGRPRGEKMTRVYIPEQQVKRAELISAIAEQHGFARALGLTNKNAVLRLALEIGLARLREDSMRRMEGFWHEKDLDMSPVDTGPPEESGGKHQP